MASELFVDNITGKTGTSGGAPITLSGDTVTFTDGGKRLVATTSITSTGSYTHNLNSLTTHIICWVQGAGGGGGGGDSATRNGTGGGAGAFCIAKLDIVYATDSTLTGSVGAGGTAGPATSGSGGTGGDSTVVWNSSNTITCSGGAGGIRAGGGPNLGGNGGTVTLAGFTSLLSQAGAKGRSNKNGSYTYGGSDGADSFLGSGGIGATTAQDVFASNGFGAGGGGGCGTGSATKAGGAGGNGTIIVYEYI